MTEQQAVELLEGLAALNASLDGVEFLLAVTAKGIALIFGMHAARCLYESWIRSELF